MERARDMHDALAGPSQSGDTEATIPDRRRGSLGRALERVKSVVRKRTGGKRKAESSPSVSPPAMPEVLIRAESTTGTPVRSRRFDQMAAPNVMPYFSDPLEALEVDTESTSSLLLPMQGSSPMSSPADKMDDRARLLFATYGLTYKPIRRTTEEPPRKLRRVEKPIRIRLRWSCHECRAPLGLQGLCGGCGHRRCGKCFKELPKKVREVIDSTKQAMEDEVKAGETSEGVKPASTPATNELPSATTTIVIPKVFDGMSNPLAILQADNPSNTLIPAQPNPNASMLLYTLQPNGQGGMTMVHRVRRTPFIDRVYKKPRQRIRWTCERCLTPFRENEVCQKCDHARCDDCVRDPTKKTKTEPDAAVLTGMRARLARAAAPAMESFTNMMH